MYVPRGVRARLEREAAEAAAVAKAEAEAAAAAAAEQAKRLSTCGAHTSEEETRLQRRYERFAVNAAPEYSTSAGRWSEST